MVVGVVYGIGRCWTLDTGYWMLDAGGLDAR